MAAGAPNPRHRLRKRLTVLGLLVVVVAVLASSDPLFAWMNRLIVDAEPFLLRHSFAGAIVFAGLAAVSAFLAFFSSTLLVPIAVHAWGEVATIALLWGGWMVGGSVAYGIGRSLGRPVARSLAGEDRLGYYEARIGRGAPFGLILLLHLALQSEIPALVLGLLRYPFRRFIMALALAEIPYALGVVYGSRFFLERQIGLLLLASAVAIALAAWAVHRLHRSLDAPDRARDS